MGEVRLFLLGANFGYVFDAGLMGSMINLPVINYYEPAMFGVKGHIALASILFCAQHVFMPRDRCPVLVRTAFWSLFGSIALTMVLSMLPTGLFQFCQSFYYDLWYTLWTGCGGSLDPESREDVA